MRKLKFLILSLLVSGCATTSALQYVEPTRDLPLADDMSRICVMRPSTLPWAVTLRINLDDESVGTLPPRSYIEFDTDEELVELSASTTWTEDKKTELVQELVPGETYYFIAKPEMTAGTGDMLPDFRRVGAEEGKAAKASCRKAKYVE